MQKQALTKANKIRDGPLNWFTNRWLNEDGVSTVKQLQIFKNNNVKKATIYISYDRWDDYSLASLAGKTLTCMTNNTSFPDPRPDMTAYGLLVEDYRGKQEVAATKGSQLERKARDNARAKLLKAMKDLAFYVNSVSDGNAEMLASSGFDLVPPPQPTGYPVIPKNSRLLDGRVSGEVKLTFGSLASAWGYEYNFATDLDVDNIPIWGDTIRTTNSKQNYIPGLTPAQRVYVRVRAYNGKGIGDWSDAISFIVR